MEHRRIRGNPFSFEGHWYLYDIYKEAHADVVIQKSAQCGASEYLTNLALHLGYQNYNTVYVMPTDDVLSAFIHGRVDPAINDSEFLRGLVQGTDNIGLKQVRNAFIYFRAYLQKNPRKHKLKTVDADCIIYDEFDELGQDVKSLGEKRLGHSRLAWERAVSTPTYPDMGISREYNLSDQREWHISCEHCKHVQTLSWPDSIVYQKKGDIVVYAQVICKSCHKPMDRLKQGEWVAKYPERQKRGYRINKLMCEMTDLRKLVKNSQSTIEHEIQEFYNSDLGEPYAPKGAKLTENDVRAARGGHMNVRSVEHKNCWMGIDVGKRHNVTIGVNNVVLFYGQIDDLKKEGGELMEIFDVAVCVIDANPELHLVREFQAQHPGQIYLAYYWPQDDKRTDIFEIVEGDGDDVDKVMINRTASADLMVNGIKKREYRLPKDIENVPEVIDQLRAPTRVMARDASGNLVAKWVEYGKPDHYFHSTLYGTIARNIYEGNVPTIESGSMSGHDRETNPNLNYDSGMKDEILQTRENKGKAQSESEGSGIQSVDRQSQADW